MIYIKLYVYMNRQEPAVYVRGGFRRSFLVTRQSSPEFRKMLARIPAERPLYALTIDKKQVKNGDLSKLFPNLMTTLEDEVLLIPCGVNSLNLPLYTDAQVNGGGARTIRGGVVIERALLFSDGNYDGYIDETFIDNPLDILKNKQVTISRGTISSTREVASALWKERNKVMVVGKRIRESEDLRIETILKKGR